MQKPDEHEMKQLKDDTVAYGISVRLFGGNQDKHSLTLASNLGPIQLEKPWTKTKHFRIEML